jgi:hypothetical protein
LIACILVVELIFVILAYLDPDWGYFLASWTGFSVIFPFLAFLGIGLALSVVRAIRGE